MKQEALPDNFRIMVADAFTDMAKWMIVPTHLVIPIKWHDAFHENYNKLHTLVGRFQILYGLVEGPVFCQGWKT